MWNLICASVVLLIQTSYVAPLTLEMLSEDECQNVRCPQLSCPNTVLKEGSCCRICVIAG